MPRRLPVLTLLFALLLAACSSPPALPDVNPQPTATPLPPPTATATPTPTPSPTPTPTPTPLPEARVEIADLALEHANWALAEREYRLALGQSSNPALQAAAQFGLAVTAYERGDYQTALDEFNVYLVSYPFDKRHADAHFIMAEAYAALGDATSAANAYRTYLQLGPPGLLDSYIFERLGDLDLAAGDLEAAARNYELALATDRSGNLNFLRLELADVYRRLQRWDDALALYDAVEANTTFQATYGLLDLYRGQVEIARGNEDAAYDHWRNAVYDHPTAYESWSALVALIDAGVEVDDFQRGLVNYYAESNAAAINAFTRYISANPDDAARAWYYLGLTHRQNGNAPFAEDALLTALGLLDPGLPLWSLAARDLAATRAYWASNLTGGRDLYLNLAAEAPNTAIASEFIYEAARIEVRLGNRASAIALWGQLAQAAEPPDADIAASAAFMAGVHAYQKGQLEESLLFFQRARDLFATTGAVGERFASNLEGLAASHFWIGKCHAALNDRPAAESAWQLTIGLDPSNYYAVRAAQLISNRPPLPPTLRYTLVADTPAARQQAEDWLATRLGLSNDGTLGDLSPTLAADPRWQRGVALWRMGVYDLARGELDALRIAYAQDSLASYQLALAFRDLGYYTGTIYAARSAIDAAGAAANPLSAPPFLTSLRFGPYYADLIVPAADKNGLDPLLVFSLVRQESLFDGQARSFAAAQGLMQIIPDTGSWIAQRLAWPDYRNDDLYRPFINVEFGTYYLNVQVDYFDGDLYAALAAYNAGPGNSEIWLREANGDPDLFVEIMRFSEPRRYIRRIVENLAIYQSLYSRDQ